MAKYFPETLFRCTMAAQIKTKALENIGLDGPLLFASMAFYIILLFHVF